MILKRSHPTFFTFKKHSSSCWFSKAPCNCKEVWNNEASKDTFIEEYIDEHDVDEIQFSSKQDQFDQQIEAQCESTIENVFQDSKKFLGMKRDIMYGKFKLFLAVYFVFYTQFDLWILKVVPKKIWQQVLLSPSLCNSYLFLFGKRGTEFD